MALVLHYLKAPWPAFIIQKKTKDLCSFENGVFLSSRRLRKNCTDEDFGIGSDTLWNKPIDSNQKRKITRLFNDCIIKTHQ